jgi:hypothetical protein
MVPNQFPRSHTNLPGINEVGSPTMGESWLYVCLPTGKCGSSVKLPRGPSCSRVRLTGVFIMGEGSIDNTCISGNQTYDFPITTFMWKLVFCVLLEIYLWVTVADRVIFQRGCTIIFGF